VTKSAKKAKVDDAIKKLDKKVDKKIKQQEKKDKIVKK